MKTISAGWRMAYVGNSKDKKCIFCARRRPGRDRSNLVVLRGKTAFVLMNRYPYTTGHLMVAPYRHVGSLAGLTSAEAFEMVHLAALCEAVLAVAMRPDGFNFGINVGRCAGAGFPGHVHLHVVPRWDGDTNFMAVVSETKVLPETLSDTYGKIVAALAGVLGAGAVGKPARPSADRRRAKAPAKRRRR